MARAARKKSCPRTWHGKRVHRTKRGACYVMIRREMPLFISKR